MSSAIEALAEHFAALDLPTGCRAASCCTDRAVSARQRCFEIGGPDAVCTGRAMNRRTTSRGASLRRAPTPICVLRRVPRETGRASPAIRVEDVRDLIEEARLTRGRAGFN